jgi:hypothetical protein
MKQQAASPPDKSLAIFLVLPCFHLYAIKLPSAQDTMTRLAHLFWQRACVTQFAILS